MTQLARLRFTLVLAALVFLASFIASPLHAQTLKGTILGTITDTSNAVVPGVQIDLTETATNFHRAEPAELLPRIFPELLLSVPSFVVSFAFFYLHRVTMAFGSIALLRVQHSA